MIKTYSHRHITWIDLENPTQEEVQTLVRSYSLHPLVGEELLGPSKSSKASVYKGYMYLVLQFPIRTKAGDYHVTREKEIDFVIGKDFIITTHYEVIQPLHVFGRAFEANAILDKDKTADHAGHIFYYMMRRMYAHMLGDLEAIKSDLTVAEGKVFSGEEKSVVEVLSNLSRELLDFRQTSRTHLEVLESLSKASNGFFDKEFTPYLADIKDSFTLVHDSIINNHELARELRETNDSLLSTKQNETIKILTVVAFVTFPLSLFVELFSMNTIDTPIVGNPHGFWIIVAAMVVVSAIMVWYFRRKKWL